MVNLTHLYEADMTLPGANRPARRSAKFARIVGGLASVLVAFAATVAWAGPVEGEIALPPGGVEEPAVRQSAFVERIKNPITELRPFDPRPECFVYLDGGPAGPDATKPPPRDVVLELGSASFLTPLLPVVVGSTVDIKNVGKNTHPIQSPEH